MKTPKLRVLVWAGVILAVAYPNPALGEPGHDAWLRYASIGEMARGKYVSLPAAVVVLGDSSTLGTAQGELIRGVKGMLGKTLRTGKGPPREKADRKSTRLNSSHLVISYAVFCLKKKKKKITRAQALTRNA